MFGFGKNKTCFYCGLNISASAKHCESCGQAQPQPDGKPAHRVTSINAPHAPSVTTPATTTTVQTTPPQIPPAKTPTRAPVAAPVKAPSPIGGFFRIAVFSGWAYVFSHFITHFQDHDAYYGRFLDWEFVGGTLASLLFLLLLASLKRALASFFTGALMLATGGALLAKPLLYPIIYEWQDAGGLTQRHIFSYTSETHLYYVMPGAILLVLAAMAIYNALFRAFGRR